MIYGILMATPPGILTLEHRWIEGVVDIMEKEYLDIKKRKKINSNVINQIADFIKNYADKCHHGKEEYIFFKALNKKKLQAVHKRLIIDLVNEHKKGRHLTRDLVDANEKFLSGKKSEIHTIIKDIKSLISLYRKHIAKEDKYFFNLSMEYLSEKERDKMVLAFFKADKKSIHKKYSNLVKKLELKKSI